MIKLLTTTAIALTFALPLSAEINTEERELCTQIGIWAHHIMEARQLGVSMSHVMSFFDEKDDYLQAIVRDAYNQPRMSHPADQRLKIEEFRNSAEFFCYEMASY